jgi:hypothetical protein
LVPRQKIIANVPQNAAKRLKTLQNTAKHRKTPQNTTKHRKTPQNTTKICKTPQNTAKRRKRAHGCCQFATKCHKAPQNAAKHRKHRKTLENAGKRRKTPENAAKRRKTPQNATKYWELAISHRRTKYLGGLKNPAPFSGLLKLIVNHNWGAMAHGPENIFSGFCLETHVFGSNPPLKKNNFAGVIVYLTFWREQ